MVLWPKAAKKLWLMVRIPTHRLLASRVHHHHKTVSVYHDRCSSPSFRRHRDDNFRDAACLGCHTAEVLFDPHRFAANAFTVMTANVFIIRGISFFNIAATHTITVNAFDNDALRAEQQLPTRQTVRNNQ